jgi:nicotinate-nucleotide pyrophosphorylase (carboxylating)
MPLAAGTMAKEFDQILWNADVEDDCRQIVRLAVREDLSNGHDWTSLALVPAGARHVARVVARQAGVIAGLPAIELILQEMETDLLVERAAEDGTSVVAGTVVARIRGSVRDLLAAERLVLNTVGRLSGVATLTWQYVRAVEGTGARIYDTRKTTPGWRRLEKYAVRCGGGRNHRAGLYAAIMIKDNHLAFARDRGVSPAVAVQQARDFLQEALSAEQAAALVVEVEVDTLAQLREVLPARPDIVLLDNMSCQQLSACVHVRNEAAPEVELEASGGVDLSTVGAIARSGVERISVGALTHSARQLDLGLDWER